MEMGLAVVVRLTGFTQEPVALDLDGDNAVQEDEGAWDRSASLFLDHN
jgi:hypothetical protein